MHNMSTIDDLAAALNGRQMTDEEGQIISESAPEKVDSLDHESKVEEDINEEPKPSEIEPDEAEDDSGNKYIPKKRFDKIYGEKKALERENAALKQSEKPKETAPEPLDRTRELEMEILFEKYPEFDPNGSRYSVELDILAGKLVKANPGITALQAAREARDLASRIAGKVNTNKSESVMVKRTVSDDGIAGRSKKVPSTPNIDIASASADDLEKYLKQTGAW